MIFSTDVHTTTVLKESHPWFPKRGSVAFRMLSYMLQGNAINTGQAFKDWNLATPNARVSEMRKKGWPIRSITAPHPYLINERMTCYILDAQFRRWLAGNPEAHPATYPVRDGRGKFA